MTALASGTFDVAMKPAAPKQKNGVTTVERLTLDKQYSGELSATGHGEMLTALSDTAGSGAYVAIETISGTLAGRTGGFAVQHAGTMGGGAEQLSIAIVPDSGHGELRGIAGTLSITFKDGQHSYALHYQLP